MLTLTLLGAGLTAWLRTVWAETTAAGELVTAAGDLATASSTQLGRVSARLRKSNRSPLYSLLALYASVHAHLNVH